MNKQNLLEKRYIVRLLGLILEESRKPKTNIIIAKALGKEPSTIHSQLEYLENQGIIYKDSIKNTIHNEKEYGVGDKLTEIFLKHIESKKGIKNILKYKNNVWIDQVLALSIYAKLKRPDVESITLNEIFDRVYDYFLTLNKNSKVREYNINKNYSAEKSIEKQTKKEFIQFLDTLTKSAKKM